MIGPASGRSLADWPQWARQAGPEIAMALSHSMMLSAVRIRGSKGLGTGFLVTVRSETLPDHRWGYLVTAHHVIAKQTEINVQIPDAFGDGALYEPMRVS